MKVSFEGKHVLITGGSEGIGLALAQQFVSDGASVTLLARSENKLKAAEALLKAEHPGSSVHVMSADVGDAPTLRDALNELQKEHGAVDIAVCNAGLAIPKLMVDQTLEEAQQVMQVNYWGSYFTAHTLLPGMISRGAGHICFMCSMAYVNPMAGFTGYGPTKAAVRHLADNLRNELSGTGVTVSVGYPPDTQTPGFDKENQFKAGATQAIIEHEQEQVHTPESVAACLFRGLQRGDYHLPTPVLFHMLGLSLVAGLTPRPFWTIIEFLIAPILVIVSVVTHIQQDSVVRKWRASQSSQTKRGLESSPKSD